MLKNLEHFVQVLKIEKNHSLVPKILDKRGTSYERIGDWEKAEQDLLEGKNPYKLC